MSSPDRLKQLRLQFLEDALTGFVDPDDPEPDKILPTEVLECSVETYLQICRLIRKHPELVHTLSRQVYPDMTDEELANIWVTAKMKRVHQS